jgi:hypothetical protein
MQRAIGAYGLLLVLTGCVSTGGVGMVAKSGANPSELLVRRHRIQELGPAQGRACRFFVVAIVPFGDSAFSTAVEQALAASGGDALLNVTTSTSLYGFVPIYNVLSFTCTAVRGTAIKIEPLPDEG